MFGKKKETAEVNQKTMVLSRANTEFALRVMTEALQHLFGTPTIGWGYKRVALLDIGRAYASDWYTYEVVGKVWGQNTPHFYDCQIVVTVYHDAVSNSRFWYPERIEIHIEGARGGLKEVTRYTYGANGKGVELMGRKPFPAVDEVLPSFSSEYVPA